MNNDNRIDGKYRLYNSGFVGSVEVDLTPEVETTQKIVFGAGLLNTISRNVSTRSCIASSKLGSSYTPVLNNMFDQDALIDLAKKHFGHSIKEWVAMHDRPEAREIGYTKAPNAYWIKETLELIYGARKQRAVLNPVWSKLLKTSEEPPNGLVMNYVKYELKNYVGHNGRITPFIKQWLSIENGILDLQNSI